MFLRWLTFEELPLPERYRKPAEWTEQHLSPADQEWIYQQWQQVFERDLEEPLMLRSLKKNHRVAPEVKEQIIKRIKEEGVPVAQAAKEHGIHEVTVYG
jgi:hypothetical protein